MKRCSVLAALWLGAARLSAQQEPPVGFFAATVDRQLAAEAVFAGTPTPQQARRWLARLTEEPHVAGTPQEKKVAEYVRDRLDEFGLQTEIVSYDVFLNHPRKVAARLVEPREEPLALMEEFLAEDKDSVAHGVFPGFHGYGASGKVSGQVVYANYGTRADFEKLDEMGLALEGRVVLARYGRVFRGLKVREAEERGAAGVLLYTDPADDGYMKGDIYPDGPMRPPSSLQRGSVQYLSIQPGDPSTPGYPSRADARRVPRAEMKTVPRIPSLPIGYGEAEKILRLLGGDVVPEGWQGGLPFAYHLGPGGAAVEIEVEMDEGLRPIYNVFGRIPGREEPERLVILGNHRDAWTHGAVDPSSGTAVWLETARGLAAAVEAGWQPRRTILLASWDAEEYGLVGSVEWGEDRAEELQAQAVAYLNLDSAVTGSRFEVGGVASLRDVVRQAAAAVAEPSQGGTLAAAWEKRLRDEWAREAPVELADPESVFELRLSALGSGSDYTVFLDHLGVASVNFGFRGRYGVYHSVYDNFRWMEKFGDPGFVYHATAARFFGLLAMRLAAADVVPLRFSTYADGLRMHLDELRRQAIRQRRLASLAETPEESPFAADFTPVPAALDRLERVGRALDRAVDELVARQDAVAAAAVTSHLLRLEQDFLAPDGLPDRPWFRHLLFAPGLTTGYAAWPFPELRQAVEESDEELFRRGVERLLTVLGRATERLGAATVLAAGG